MRRIRGDREIADLIGTSEVAHTPQAELMGFLIGIEST